MEDQKISINELKAVNSGIPQGTFMKKALVKKDDRVMHPVDFRVGQDVSILGNTFHIYGCDELTRKFSIANDREQEPNFEPPLSNFESNDKFKKEYKPIKDKDMKKYEHSKMGGPMIKDERKFLMNDRKVLKFYVMADELMVMHY